MTTEDALITMDRIDDLDNGTVSRYELVNRLYEKLLTDPEELWQTFLESLEAEKPNAYREMAERLLKSGAVNEHTTIADIVPLMEWDRAEQRGR